MKRAIVTGAGGFIGNHFTTYLKEKGYYVIGVDVVQPSFSVSKADEFKICDLRNPTEVNEALSKVDEIYMFAADMGGVGYIHRVSAPIVSNNVLINVNTLEKAHELGIRDVFFASSACVYPEYKQNEANVTPLKESMVLPAMPDSPYGWEKLFTEQVAGAFNRDYGMQIRVARFHNIYGPEGAFDGGREKAPAAICRKVAELTDGEELEIWGDGTQTRSFCYIADCCEGVYRLMQSECTEPLNIGSSELISIDDLAYLVAKIAGKKIKIKHLTSEPQGVRGRNSDNTLIKEVLDWEPACALEVGMKKTYSWIASHIDRD